MQLTLSENILSFRKQRRLTQEQLAEVLGVTPGAVHKWESGLSVPELPMIVELADFFDMSVDALLGYRSRNNSLDAFAERINTFLRTSDPAAISEAEKALKKYPNSFIVTYGCAQVYYVFGVEDHSNEYLRRALELFDQALLLISQNTDPYISEYTIYGTIGSIHVFMGEAEKGIELMKKHNTSDLLDLDIGLSLAILLDRAEESVPFLSDAMRSHAFEMLNAVMGLAFVFSRRGDFVSEQDITDWAIAYFSGLWEPGAQGYNDKLNAVLYAIRSHALMHRGYAEEARSSLLMAAEMMYRFDADPDRSADGMRFVEGRDDISIHDFLGRTAEDSIRFILDHLKDSEFTSLWEKTMEILSASSETDREEHA